MYLTHADPPGTAAVATDRPAAGVRRSWLATEESGGSRFAQVSVLTVPPATSCPVPGQHGEQICVLVSGEAKLLIGNKTRSIEKGAVIHSTNGDAFTIETENATATALLLSATPQPDPADDHSQHPDDPAPVDCFSLYDVHDETLHQPEAGFYHMGTRMLLNATQGGYQSFIFGQSSFAATSGIHVMHRHPGADEFFYVWEGDGAHLASDRTEHPMTAGDAVFVPRNEWHGFRNTGDQTVRAFFCLIGTGTMDQAGNELLSEGTPVNAFDAPNPAQPGPTWMTEARAPSRMNPHQL